MKQLLIMLVISLVSCKTMQPPTYQHKTEAQYVGFDKESNYYVMKFWSRKYDTSYVTQNTKPHFHYREYVILAWNCSDVSQNCTVGTVNIKIFKSR